MMILDNGLLFGATLYILYIEKAPKVDKF